MKRFLGVLLVLALLWIPSTARADYDYESIPTPNMIVVDGDDPNVVFYERNADQRVYPASTTKIMTCLIALEHGNLDDSFMVGEEVLGHVQAPGQVRARGLASLQDLQQQALEAGGQLVAEMHEQGRGSRTLAQRGAVVAVFLAEALQGALSFQ